MTLPESIAALRRAVAPKCVYCFGTGTICGPSRRCAVCNGTGNGIGPVPPEVEEAVAAIEAASTENAALAEESRVTSVASSLILDRCEKAMAGSEALIARLDAEIARLKARAEAAEAKVERMLRAARDEADQWLSDEKPSEAFAVLEAIEHAASDEEGKP